MSAPICALLRSIGQGCAAAERRAAERQEEEGGLPTGLLLGCGLGAAVLAGLALAVATYFACRRRAAPTVGRGLPLLR
jgi:hypothetical protein